MKEREYQQCSMCVMDTISDPQISFDEKGICNYYYDFLKDQKEKVLNGEEGRRKLNELFDLIKAEGKGKKYDTLLGVSGGVDSTYLAWLCKQHNLRVLLFHFDNGWNSELAVQNISNMSEKLGYDLNTYVMDWPMFKDLQKAYFEADVVDIEALTDHLAHVVTRQLAKKLGIRVMISGGNVNTEQLLPKYWRWNKTDGANIIDIHKKYGSIPLKKGTPIWRPIDFFKAINVAKQEFHQPLNYVEYDSAKAKEIIKTELNWRDYGGKHYESIFTRFYQGYILPEKFQIDKRKAHFSNLIFAGVMNKAEALEKLKQPIYPQEVFEIDYDFALKKLDFTREKFDAYMARPRKEHEEFETDKTVWEQYPILNILRKVTKPIRRVLKK